MLEDKKECRAKDSLDGRQAALGRIAVAICSWFVLLALALAGYHVQGADFVVRSKLHAEAAFETVYDRESRASQSFQRSARLKDRAVVHRMNCQRCTNWVQVV